MIVVTGSARTGTSMVMQTLMHLGMDLIAPKFGEAHKGKEHHNKKGYYEFSSQEEYNSLREEHRGKCVKLWANYYKDYKDKGLVDKVIVCQRDKEDAVKSSVPVFKSLGYNISPEEVYDVSYQTIENNLNDISSLFLKFEDTLNNPYLEVYRIIRFLGIDPDLEQISKAIRNIKRM